MNLFQENADIRAKADAYKAELEVLRKKVASSETMPAPESAVRVSMHGPHA